MFLAQVQFHINRASRSASVDNFLLLEKFKDFVFLRCCDYDVNSRFRVFLISISYRKFRSCVYQVYAWLSIYSLLFLHLESIPSVNIKFNGRSRLRWPLGLTWRLFLKSQISFFKSPAFFVFFLESVLQLLVLALRNSNFTL
jgi:hypothetical protein